MLRLVMLILWPSFLSAIIAEGVFFSLFDPHELIFAGRHIALSTLAAYTIGFFMFWFFCAMASLLTYYLSKVPDAPGRTSN